MSNQKPQHKTTLCGREYWDSNLDPQNIRRSSRDSRRSIEQEIAFYETPEHLHARRLMGNIAGKRVLELGAGLSVHPIILARAGALVVAADVSLERIKSMQSLVKELGLDEKVLFVCCAAEFLPMRSQTVEIAYTKSVLIHTQLAPAASEVFRVLKPEGSGVFVEPLRYNPFVVVYRTFFAPPEWRKITNYFDHRRLALLRRIFGNLSNHQFYFLSFLAFYWQFVRRDYRKFYAALRLLMKADRFILRLIPFLRRFCWFAVIYVRKKNER
jgi:ubiquinone/menaquinone biosynthesis C-methylase UbiE